MVVYEVKNYPSFVKPKAKGSVVSYQNFTYASPILTNASSFISDTDCYFLEIDCGNTMSIDPFNLAWQNFNIPESTR